MNNQNLKIYLEQKLLPSSSKFYYYEITRYLAINPNAALYDYTQIMHYIESLRKNNAPATIYKIVGILKAYYDYLIFIELREDNPARAIKLLDSKKKAMQLQDLLSETELEAILESRPERYCELAKRNQVIFSLLIHQALRVEEIIKLRATDIFLEKAQVQVNQTPQANKRILPLKASQIILFQTYLQQDRLVLKSKKTANTTDRFLLTKDGIAFEKKNLFGLINTCQKQINKKLSATKIRQSIITNLLSKGNELRWVQEFAGHKSIDTTEKYKQSGIKALQNAIEKHHPIK